MLKEQADEARNLFGEVETGWSYLQQRGMIFSYFLKPLIDKFKISFQVLSKEFPSAPAPVIANPQRGT